MLCSVYSRSILVLPVIVTNQTIQVLLGNKIVIHCNASGVPSPNVTISRKSVDGSGQIVVSREHSLTITAASTVDEGTFVCMAQNEAGMTQVEVTLSVLGNCSVYFTISKNYHSKK